MNVESIVEDLLNMPKMSKCLDLLKTNNWKKLDVSKKKKVFETINKCFCEYLGLKNNGIVVREDPLKKEIFGGLIMEYGTIFLVSAIVLVVLSFVILTLSSFLLIF